MERKFEKEKRLRDRTTASGSDPGTISEINRIHSKPKSKTKPSNASSTKTEESLYPRKMLYEQLRKHQEEEIMKVYGPMVFNRSPSKLKDIVHL